MFLHKESFLGFFQILGQVCWLLQLPNHIHTWGYMHNSNACPWSMSMEPIRQSCNLYAITPALRVRSSPRNHTIEVRSAKDNMICTHIIHTRLHSSNAWKASLQIKDTEIESNVWCNAQQWWAQSPPKCCYSFLMKHHCCHLDTQCSELQEHTSWNWISSIHYHYKVHINVSSFKLTPERTIQWVTKNKKIRWVTRTHFLKLNIKHSLPVHIKVSSIKFNLHKRPRCFRVAIELPET